MKKPFKTVAVIGARQSGKTSVLSALTRHLESMGPTDFQSVEALTKEANEHPAHITFAQLESPAGRLECIDAGGSGGTASEVEALSQADVALIIHRADRDAPEALAQRIRAARQLEVAWTCAFIIGAGKPLPSEAREASRAVEAKAPDDTAAFEALFSAIAEGPTPTIDVDGPFFLRIASIFLPRPGVALPVGLCLRGQVMAGADVELLGVGPFLVTGVTCYGKLTDQGHAGQELGLMLRRFTPSEDLVGAAIVAQGSMTARTSATVELPEPSASLLPSSLRFSTRLATAEVKDVQQEGTRARLSWSSARPVAAGASAVLHDGTRFWPVRVVD